MTRDKISIAVIKRLPRYYRYLDELYTEGVVRISSEQLAKLMGGTASQIRQDLNCFGGFGQQGYGYNIEFLRKSISEIMGLDRDYTAIVIGAGNMGRALINNFKFERRGFKLLAVFDIDENLAGKTIGNERCYEVKHMSELENYVKENKPSIAVLTVPRGEARKTARDLADWGIKGIWNFTNMDLRLGDTDVKVENVYMSDGLMTLCYHIAEDQKK